MAPVMAFIGREIARLTSQDMIDATITDNRLLAITTVTDCAPVCLPSSVQWSDQALISSCILSIFWVKARDSA